MIPNYHVSSHHLCRVIEANFFVCSENILQRVWYHQKGHQVQLDGIGVVAWVLLWTLILYAILGNGMSSLKLEVEHGLFCSFVYGEHAPEFEQPEPGTCSCSFPLSLAVLHLEFTLSFELTLPCEAHLSEGVVRAQTIDCLDSWDTGKVLKDLNYPSIFYMLIIQTAITGLGRKMKSLLTG